jgi:hypothetical protein
MRTREQVLRADRMRRYREKSRSPGSLDEALELDISERAKALQRDPHMAQWVSPQEWPEVVELAEAWGETRLGQYERDSGVRAAVEAFAAGFSLDELKSASEALVRSGYAEEARAKGRKLGMSSLSPEVIRRALSNGHTGKPNGKAKRESDELSELLQEVRDMERARVSK